jgi:uncharacterized protein (DUF305 family)
MKRFLLIIATTTILTGSAIAHQNPPSMDMKTMEMDMTPQTGDSEATKGYKASMMKMMKAMPAFTGDADIDFMKHMRPHHQAAIDMGKVLLATGKDAETKKMAEEIISAQEKEIATIDAWLKKKGQ